MNRNYKFGIGAVLLVSSIGYLMYAGVEQSSAYYFTIEEFLPRREAMAGQGLRLAGRVAPGSLTKHTSADGTAMKFRVGHFTDEAVAAADTVAVEYTGIVPDMFAEGRDVIIEGTYASGVVQAKSVMTSCPSKYEPEVEVEGKQAAAY
jgi:cytochrome c-type biogenesis protein CcmE